MDEVSHFPVQSCCGSGRGSAGYLEEPYPGIAARAHRRIEPSVYGLRIEAFEGHLHVRLSGTKPDFADENVVERDPFPVVDSQRIRAPGSGRPEPCVPASFPVGAHVVRLRIPRSGEFYPRIRRGPSPDAGFAVALEHHAAADERRQPYPPRSRLGEA